VLALFAGLLLADTAAGAEREPLRVETGSGDTVEFQVELALTPEQRSVGLMHRDRLEPLAGMLFIYPGPQQVSMWMRGTRIPLDMFFIGPQGTIVKIRERAVPYSEEVISSEQPVVAVLEVNGGTASRFGIRPGDRVELPEAAQ
jgi:uncharacterized membrane protein (UPF0127 family)